MAAEVVNSMVLEFASQKEKAVQLIPGADVKSFLGDGDDVIQTHAESGRLKCMEINHNNAWFTLAT